MPAHTSPSLTISFVLVGCDVRASQLSKSVIFFMVLAYLPVSNQILGVFQCTQIADRSYLVADLAKQCYTQEHKTYMGVGLLGILLFPIGVPLMYLQMLLRCKILEIIRVRDTAFSTYGSPSLVKGTTSFI